MCACEIKSYRVQWERTLEAIESSGFSNDFGARDPFVTLNLT